MLKIIYLKILWVSSKAANIYSIQDTDHAMTSEVLASARDTKHKAIIVISISIIMITRRCIRSELDTEAM